MSGVNLTKIPASEQEGVLSSFWTMLRDCESRADSTNDPVGRHLVSEWYKQWNRITGQNHVPAWVARGQG
jgi:hypothetical protein